MARYLELRGGTLDTAVKGTSYHQRDVPKVGDYIFVLVAEPRNKTDPNAVAVHAKRLIGYLPREIAPRWSILCQRIGRKRFAVPGQVRLTPDGKARWALLWLPDPLEVNERFR
jgi:hypothetical protein